MQELLETAKEAVASAKPDEQMEAVVVDNRETEIRVYEGEVESHLTAVSQGIGIRIIKNHKQGFASTGSLDSGKILQTIEEARDNAELGTEDEFLDLTESDGVEKAELNLYNDSLLTVGSDKKTEIAVQMEEAILKAHPSIIGVETSEYSDSLSSAAVASTKGIAETMQESSCSLMAYCLASENDTTETGFGFSVGRDFGELDFEKAAGDAVERATRLLGAKKPKSCVSDIILDPWVTAQFLSIVGGTLSGEAVVKGRSLFRERLGEAVAADCVNLVDDPTNPKAPSAVETDGEGLATRKNILIEDGVLNQFLHNSYTARRMETASTGSAVRGYASTPGVGCMALSLSPGQKSQKELMETAGSSVLIQGVSGLHSGVNPVSGDFSTGAEGLMIRGGELADPVREFTIGSTLQKMLLNITETGSDLEWLPMNSAGLSLLIRDVTISGE